jgi:DNA-binding MarR family transcriptional regulator
MVCYGTRVAPMSGSQRPFKMPRKSSKQVQGPLDLEGLYKAPGHLIRRSQQIAVALFYSEFKDVQITPVQYAALAAIHSQPGIDQRTLVTLIAIDRSTVGTLVRLLEERGLISRVTPKDDQRVKRLFIGPEGRKLLTETRETMETVQQRILAPLNPSERKTFMASLAKIVRLNNNYSRAPLKIDSD